MHEKQYANWIETRENTSLVIKQQFLWKFKLKFIRLFIRSFQLLMFDIYIQSEDKFPKGASCHP